MPKGLCGFQKGNKLGEWKRTSENIMTLKKALVGRKMPDGFGKRRSEYMKKHPTKYWLGKKRGVPSLEWRQKISKSLKGIKRSVETRKKMSEAQMGEKNHMYGKIGALAGNYKNGRMQSGNGYIYILNRDHPNKNKHNYVFEHQLVMEKKLGRYINKNERIHHIDCNPTNNDLENLFLTDSSGAAIAHHSLNKLVKQLLDNNIIIFDKEKGIYEYRT